MITVAYGISHKVVDSIKANKFAIFIICKSVFWGDIWKTIFSLSMPGALYVNSYHSYP